MKEHRITTGVRFQSWLDQEQRRMFVADAFDPKKFQETIDAQAKELTEVKSELKEIKDLLRQRDAGVVGAGAVSKHAKAGADRVSGNPEAHQKLLTEIRDLLQSSADLRPRDIGGNSSGYRERAPSVSNAANRRRQRESDGHDPRLTSISNDKSYLGSPYTNVERARGQADMRREGLGAYGPTIQDINVARHIGGNVQGAGQWHQTGLGPSDGWIDRTKSVNATTNTRGAWKDPDQVNDALRQYYHETTNKDELPRQLYDAEIAAAKAKNRGYADPRANDELEYLQQVRKRRQYLWRMGYGDEIGDTKVALERARALNQGMRQAEVTYNARQELDPNWGKKNNDGSELPNNTLKTYVSPNPEQVLIFSIPDRKGTIEIDPKLLDKAYSKDGIEILKDAGIWLEFQYFQESKKPKHTTVHFTKEGTFNVNGYPVVVGKASGINPESVDMSKARTVMTVPPQGAGNAPTYLELHSVRSLTNKQIPIPLEGLQVGAPRRTVDPNVAVVKHADGSIDVLIFDDMKYEMQARYGQSNNRLMMPGRTNEVPVAEIEEALEKIYNPDENIDRRFELEKATSDAQKNFDQSKQEFLEVWRDKDSSDQEKREASDSLMKYLRELKVALKQEQDFLGTYLESHPPTRSLVVRKKLVELKQGDLLKIESELSKSLPPDRPKSA